MNELFPIFLKAAEIQILLVGGGPVAEEKLHFLLKSSPKAKVHIVTIDLKPELRKIIEQNSNLTLEERAYQPKDAKGKHFVVVAANNQPLNKEIRAQSKEEAFLLNVADQPVFCDFYLGGIVTKGDLKIAISTNGKAPILARRMREFFEQELPDTLEDTIHQLHILRKKLKGNFDEKLKKLSQLTKNIIQE